jgi:tetratricopeptide (TPR) repeat protein
VAHHLERAGRPARAAREWAAAAGYARSVGALAEAAEFLGRAVELAPADGGLWLDLEEVQAWRGRRADMEAAWERAIALLHGDDLVRAWCRRGRQLRTVVCHPEASLRAYQSARQAWTGVPDAETLIGLAWGEAVAGDPVAADALLADAEAALPAGPAPQTRADITEIRMQGLIRRGRFADAARVARDTGEATTPDRAYGVWINAACALACAGDYPAALELADRAVATTEPVPVLLLGCLAARAHLLARLGRHAEAAETCADQRARAARLDSPALAAQAAHDAGLVALAAGRFAEAAALLAEALDGSTPASRAPGSRVAISRPTAGLYRAEALCRAGDPETATLALRNAMLEPVGRADQPWALVPRIALVQGLIARAKGDPELAAGRFAEAAAAWRRMLPSAADATAEGYTAALLDLGRPPVVGLVEPARELAAVEEEMSCPPL